MRKISSKGEESDDDKSKKKHERTASEEFSPDLWDFERRENGEGGTTSTRKVGQREDHARMQQ